VGRRKGTAVVFLLVRFLFGQAKSLSGKARKMNKKIRRLENDKERCKMVYNN